MPAMMLKNVVLPAPLGPMMLTMAPVGISKSILLTATRPPKRFVTLSALRTRPSAGVATPEVGVASDAASAVTRDLPLVLRRHRALRRVRPSARRHPPRRRRRAAHERGGGSGRALRAGTAS